MDFLPSGSPDCPLIRLYSQDPEEFSAFRDVVQRHAADGGEHAVHDLPMLQGKSGCELTMITSPSDEGVVQTGKGRQFNWILTAQKWPTVAGLIEPFTAVSEAGIHQWLAGGEAPYGLDIGETALLISTSPDGRW